MTRDHAAPARRPRRGGTTLIEVLMSLLVMAIGIVGVATLFPISVLRSADATRHTSAAALFYSVGGLIDATQEDPNPQTGAPGCDTAALALDPDGDRDPANNDVDANPQNNSPEMYVVDPLGYWRLRQEGQTHAVA